MSATALWSHTGKAMMENSAQAYGLWGLALINIVVFVGFAFSFFKPVTMRDWRTFGAFSAFIVALFVEMYGFPLTIYLASGWLQARYPQIDLLSHNAGHLWWTLGGQQGNPHFAFLHILSITLIGAGFWLLAAAWHVLYHAQRPRALAIAGPYTRIRHPQYVAFVVIMLGFLLQWPTLLTLVMFPVLVLMYVRLAYHEEREAEREFGQAWRDYAARTPRFVPHLGGSNRTQRS